MSSQHVIEHSIVINASATAVEQCFTDLKLMHRWLNPALRCEPVGEWTTELGGRSRFVIRIPLIEPTLYSTVVAREPGLVVWQFTGFFKGRDRWECFPTDQGKTKLINRFEFQIPNPMIQVGFETFAESFTKSDMQAQLERLKRVAEEVYQLTAR